MTDSKYFTTTKKGRDLVYEATKLSPQCPFKLDCVCTLYLYMYEACSITSRLSKSFVPRVTCDNFFVSSTFLASIFNRTFFFLGEIFELKAELHSEKKEKRKEAVKKVIASMTVGKDVRCELPIIYNLITAF